MPIRPMSPVARRYRASVVPGLFVAGFLYVLTIVAAIVAGA